MPIQIQTADGWRRLQKAFSIVGRHRLMLDEVVVPVAILEDLTLLADTANDRANISIRCDNTAGTNGAAVFSNLPDTGTTLLLETITLNAQTAQVFNINQTTIAPILPLGGSSSISKTWNDPTQPGAPAGSGFANDNVFGITGQIQRVIINANVVVQFQVNQIVPPLQQISVGGFTNNAEFQVSFDYRVIPTRD